MSTSQPKYWAFISYSHRDERIARHTLRWLEGYRLPRSLVGSKTATGILPARLKPVFRDRDELEAGADLKALVREALAESRFLIVICSPASARSLWVNQEIVEFKRMHGEGRVLALIAAGEPFASRLAGREADECFPAALRENLTTGGVVEPIAADLRPRGDGARRAMLKLVAGMIGVGVDQLIRRDAQRRMRQLTAVAAGALAGMAAMTALAVAAMRSRAEAKKEAHRANVAQATAEAEARRADDAANAARREAERANAEAAISRAVTTFLTSDILDQADSHRQGVGQASAPNPDLKVREALDRADGKVATRFKNQPLTEAAVRAMMGSTYIGIGEYAKAERHYQKAFDLRTELLGAEHPETLSAWQGVMSAYHKQRRYADAVVLGEQILERQKRVSGADSEATLAAMAALANAYGMDGRRTEAQALRAEVFAAEKRLWGREHPRTLQTMRNVGISYVRQEKYAEALAVLAEVLTLETQLHGPNHLRTLAAIQNLGWAHLQSGNHAEAERLLKQAWDRRQQVLGPSHPDTLASMARLLDAYQALGKKDDAAALEAEINRRKSVAGGGN